MTSPSGPARNIELKARLADPDAARAAARRLGARLDATLRQTDTYFVVPHGRLKLREFGSGPAELIFYHRPDSAGWRASDYRLVPVADAGPLRELLSAALGVRGVVRKVREVWLWENVRIHVDQVEGLGTFLEFEVLVGPDFPEALCRTRAEELARAFGFGEGERIAGSYADMSGGEG